MSGPHVRTGVNSRESIGKAHTRLRISLQEAEIGLRGAWAPVAPPQ